LDNRLFFLINRAQHRVFKFANSKSEQLLGVSVTQVAALLHVAKNEGCSQKDLSGALGLNSPAVTGLVSRMEKNGLVERKSCAEDGRALRIYLTRTGQGKLATIFPLIEELNASLVAGFSDDEIEVVIRFLNKVLQNHE
jgi:DNA-binding MarR family transcriptional regulator